MLINAWSQAGYVPFNVAEQAGGYLHAARLCIGEPAVADRIREILQSLSNVGNEYLRGYMLEVITLFELEASVAPVLMEVIKNSREKDNGKI
jgi:hypothetical protein